MRLNEIGTTSENCQVENLVEGDLVKQVSIYHSTSIDQIAIETLKGVSFAVGKQSVDTSVNEFKFEQETYRFFGL